MTIHPITKKPLKKDTLNNNVIGQIAQDNDNIFFSQTTKESMNAFINDKTNKNETAILLWKNLLIDSICLLKMNDNRERLYKTFKEIYAKGVTKFCESFDKIRLMSSYGIDELVEYFTDFVDFESVLYGTSKHYRDHVLHLLQVWAIGIGIFCNQEHKLSLPDKYEYSGENFTFLIKESKPPERKYISKSEIWAMWTIIALCHDLGYPIEKASKINQETRKIVNHFGCLNFQELNYSFEIFNGYIVEKFLNIISSKAIKAKDPSEINKTAIQSKYHDKFSKSLEDFKHGMFSGLLIFKKLTYFLETDYYQGSELNNEDLRQFYIRKEILRAICGHTCPKIYHINLNTLSFLLILCDEIQEWNRPNFDDFRLRITENDPDVQIEYELDTQKFHIMFKYDINCNNDNYKYLVINRFKTLHFLLRSAKDDKDRKISFQWEIEFKNRRYTFKFTSPTSDLNEIILFRAKRNSGGTFSSNEEFNLYDKKSQEFT